MKIILIFFCLICMTSCATKFSVERLTDYELDLAIKQKEYNKVLKEFSFRENEVSSKDILILMLNKSIVLHYNHMYKESNDVLFKAKRMVEFQTLDFSENIKKYILSEKHNNFKLEPHEELFIFNLISLNYAAMGNFNEALVEARSWDYKLGKNENSISFNKENNYYLSYLSAIFYENNKKNYDAYIDYKRVLPHYKNFPYVGYDIYRILSKMGKSNANEAIKYDIDLGYQEHIKSEKYKNDGEVIIVFFNGIGPYKIEGPNNSNVPIYAERLSVCEKALITINDQDYGYTIPLFDINKTATELLLAQYKKRSLDGFMRMIAKESIAIPLDIVSMGSTSIISRALLYSQGGVDFRSWTYLPKEIQIARIPLKKGVHYVKIQMNDEIISQKIKIEAGKSKVISVNYQKSI